jgi:hypothetical protein
MARWQVCIALIGTFMLGVAFASVGLLVVHRGAGWLAHAQSAGCSNATLSGSYGVLLSGFSLTDPDGTPLASPLPRGAANVVTADGAGNLSRIGTGNVGGTVGPQPGTGTYTVNADCTFAVTINSPAVSHVAGVLVHGGARAFAVNSDPGAFIAMTWELQ